MAIAVRTLDDGAWISVNDARVVSVSDIWPLAVHDFCDCETAYFLLEAFYDVGVDGGDISVGAVGQCVDCGVEGSVDGLVVGRMVDGEFRPYDPGSVQATLEPTAASR